jgi:predicted RNase H-like nuclease (RuvC/YqgF family)
MQKNLLVVGIDPGTTLGYAVLDIGRNLLKVSSSKMLDISILTSELMSHGRVLIIGCDKKRIPDFVDKMATRLGARIISPDEDMLVQDKRSITSSLPFRNDHEMDALASALFAYKKIHPLINDINDYLEKISKPALKHRLIEIMLLNPEFNMKNIIEMLEKPEKQENRIMAKIIEQRIYTKSDYTRLFNKLMSLEQQDSALQKRNNELLSLQDFHKKAIRELDSQIASLSRKESADQRIKNLRKSILALSSKVSSSNAESEELRNELSLVYSFLADTKSNTVLKKLKDLGNGEFEKKRSLLNIQEDDILLVENPSVISYKVLESIKGKVHFIISREKVQNSLLENYGMTILSAKKFFLREERYFALVDSAALRKEIETASLLNDVIANYRDERKKTI